MSGGYFQFQSPQLRVIPMRRFNKEQQQPIVDLVQKINNGEQDRISIVRDLDKEIDQIFYSLYELNAQEMQAIEEVIQIL